jgi:hypothetical protein
LHFEQNVCLVEETARLRSRIDLLEQPGEVLDVRIARIDAGQLRLQPVGQLPVRAPDKP